MQETQEQDLELENYLPEPKKIQIMDLETALTLCGNGHTYQYYTLKIFFLWILVVSFFLKGYQLYFAEPIFICSLKTPEGEFETKINKIWTCTQEEACTMASLNNENSTSFYGYEIDPTSEESLTKEYKLYCKNRFYIEGTKQVFAFGGALGALYFAKISEMKGRIKVFQNSASLFLLACFLSLFAYSINLFVIALFIMNFAFRGYYAQALTYITEITSPNLRVIGPILIMFAWALGLIVQSIFAMLIYNWRLNLILICLIPSIILSFKQRILQESPRYLVVKKKFKDAKEALLNIAGANQRSVPEFQLKEEITLNEMHDNLAKATGVNDEDIVSQSKNYQFYSLFKYNSIRVRSYILTLIVGLTAFARLLIKAIFDGYQKNIFLDQIIFGFIELVGVLVGAYLLLNFSRLKVIKTIFVIVGLTFLGFIYFPENLQKNTVVWVKIIVMSIYTINTALLYAAIVWIYIYISEIYPTVVRHLAFGYFFFIFTIIEFLVPIFDSLLRLLHLSPFFVLGIIFVASTIPMIKLREEEIPHLKDNLIEEKDILLNQDFYD